MKNCMLVLFLLLCCGMASAQLASGFKAGLNFSSFRGPSELDGNGNELESYNYTMGFHVGGKVIYRVTDLFGVQLEILFSQKGTSYNFDGPSYFVLTTELDRRVATTGSRLMDLTITNAYIDLPLIAYFKLGSRFEISGGINLGFLVNSTATGEVAYSGEASNGAPVESFSSSLEYNYFRDEFDDVDLTDAISRTVNGEIVQIPRTLNAYYEYPQAIDGGYFNILDFGLNAGLAFYINRGLYLGVRANYGLSDVGSNDFDVSRVNLNGDNLIFRTDNDTNLSIQTSLGFSF